MLQLKKVTKEYPVGDGSVVALNEVNLDFRKSEFIAILGPSGCGKTTLLNIVGGLDSYTEGDLVINGKSTKDFKDADWDTYRNHRVGFVFQSYNLISHQSALSNVEMALKISGISKTDRRARAMKALKEVGLEDQANKKPGMMSGGQMQRVAIARALVNNPDIILADEPTGALDSETGIQIMEILKEVAGDRLVVMVTHNPDLAHEYATRTIQLKDGSIVSDSNPVSEGEASHVAEEEPSQRVKLSFLTALGLSANNLLTKKGRTLLTCFAGAIGIIGIALILALSHGMNDYIAGVESDTMGSYPIELEKETIDMNSMMEAGENGFMSNMSAEEVEKISTGITSNNIVAATVESSDEMLKKNNLGSFKTYLEDNYGSIEDSIAAIDYGYNVTPQVYRNGTEEGEVIKVSPASLLNESGSISSESGAGGMGGLSMGSTSLSGSTSSAWTQVSDNSKLREKHYELLEGEWPNEYNEIALVIDENNEISDYILYTLGLMDIDHMNELVTKVENGQEYEDPQEQFTYADALGLEFKVFSQSSFYVISDEGDNEEDSAPIWVDKGDDEEYLTSMLDSGTTVKITAVLRATDEADVSGGIIYTDNLTSYLMDQSAASAIVKQQIADPTVNVLTGERFEEEKEEELSESNATDEPAENSSQVSTEKDSFDVRATTASYTPEVSITQQASELVTTFDEGDTSAPTPATYTVRFLNYDGAVLSPVISTYIDDDAVTNAPTKTPIRAADTAYDYLFIGWKSSTTNNIYSSNNELPVVTENVDYTAFYYAQPKSGANPSQPQISGGGTGEGSDARAGAATDLGMSSGGSSGFTANDLSAYGDMSGYSSSNDVSSMDMSALSGGAASTLTDDQLLVLLAQMSNDTPSTYEEVLEALGYAKVSDPSSISLYPADFEGKEAIQRFIDDYNAQVSSDADKVTYTDIVGILTSSITSIVNIISAILIAFVAISLIVSSIMIAIITYISVLERTKEIGILRAIGASKSDVTKIFNAETFIEGLASGLIGVVVTLLLCIPINAVVFAMFGVDNIASLPLEYSLILIAISVVLTLLAGFIPSRIAAKKDPVVALRTE